MSLSSNIHNGFVTTAQQLVPRTKGLKEWIRVRWREVAGGIVGDIKGLFNPPRPVPVPVPGRRIALERR